MDIHRCRFVPYTPSAINALAFSHPWNPTAPSKGSADIRLAIGRANGDIEIWNPLKGAWYQESVLRGGKDRSIEGLVWIQDPAETDRHGYKIPGKLRLFSIGYSTAVTEWDLASARPLRHSAGNYGEIWCMAAQPKGPASLKPAREEKGNIAKEEESQTQSIAVGCADGAIVLLNTADDDLRFTKILARPAKKKSRVLSLTFQNRHTIIAGHADSTIRIYDFRNAQQVRNMTLGAGPRNGPKETLVWSVKCMNDGTIVSGDSTGTVSFWDGKNYTLLQRIQSHEVDILEIAVSADGQSVFSGGMDRRTTLYKRTSGGESAERNRWAQVTHQRMHKHDVKAMATLETRTISVLVSGGNWPCQLLRKSVMLNNPQGSTRHLSLSLSKNSDVRTIALSRTYPNSLLSRVHHGEGS
jgi:U3 small nucleolar RNA-associated protein 4